MADASTLGPWVRRFLLEHLIGERNLSVNTQRSYRDTFALLIPFVARQVHKKVDELSVVDLSEKYMVQFLDEIEQVRGCSSATRNQRLAAIHALSHFVAVHSPENIAWCGQIRAIPFKKCVKRQITHLDKPEMDALLAAPDIRPLKAGATISCCCFSTIPAHAQTRRRNSTLVTLIWRLRLAGTYHPSESKVRATRSVAALYGRRR